MGRNGSLIKKMSYQKKSHKKDSDESCDCGNDESPPRCRCGCDKITGRNFLPIPPNFLGITRQCTSCRCVSPYGIKVDQCTRLKDKYKAKPKPKRPRRPAPPGICTTPENICRTQKPPPKPKIPDDVCEKHRGRPKKKVEPPKLCVAATEQPGKLPSILDVLNKDNGCYCGIVANAFKQMTKYQKDFTKKCCDVTK